jgi:hypothetical protein
VLRPGLFLIATLLASPGTAGPLTPDREPAWAAVGASARGEVQVPAGEVLLVLHAASGRRSGRLEARAGELALEADILPELGAHALGRLRLGGAGQLPVSLRVLAMGEGGGPLLTEAGRLEVLPLASEPQPARPLIPRFDLVPLPVGTDPRAHLDRAQELGARRVQFRLGLACTVDHQGRPLHFALPPPSGEAIRPLTEADRQTWMARLRPWLAAAVERDLAIDLDLTLLPQGERPLKPSEIDLDPLLPVGGFSYARAVVQSATEALEASVPGDWPVCLLLQDGLSTSAARHPDRWRQMIRQFRQAQSLHRLEYGLGYGDGPLRGGARPQEVEPTRLLHLWREIDFLALAPAPSTGFPLQVGDPSAALARLHLAMVAQGLRRPPHLTVRLDGPTPSEASVAIWLAYARSPGGPLTPSRISLPLGAFPSESWRAHNASVGRN